MSFNEWLQDADEPEDSMISAFKWGIGPFFGLLFGGWRLGIVLEPTSSWISQMGAGLLAIVLALFLLAVACGLTFIVAAFLGLGVNVGIRKLHAPIYQHIQVIRDRKAKMAKPEAGQLNTPQPESNFWMLEQADDVGSDPSKARAKKMTPKPSKGESIKR